MMHIADNQDALLDYLYEEGDAAERLKIATHLQQCARCSVAVLEFRTVRGMLSDWTPPSAQLGFRIVQDAEPAQAQDAGPARYEPRRAWWGWTQAAAAVALFVAGMAVSQLTVQYVDGALIVRTAAAPSVPAAGDIRLPPAAIDAASGVPPTSTDSVRGTDERLAGGERIDTEQLLQRVRAMIDQSEQRQQRQLALRLSQVASEVDAQHQADLLRIQQNFGQQQEVMDYLVRTSGVVK
jgi:hypothetical protein